MSEELKAAQARIACLEGEIAKRDEELSACRVAVENCEMFRARIGELESIVDKAWNRSHQLGQGAYIPGALDAWKRPVLQNLPYDFSGNPGTPATQYCNGWNDAGGYWKAHVDDLLAELSALKAQEPVAEIALSDDGYKIGLLGALRNHRLPIGTKLYAAPVSEAKAQGDYAPDSVVWIDAHHVIEGNNPSFIKDVALVSAERTSETQIPLVRLNAAPVQQVSVPDGWKLVPVELTREMAKAVGDLAERKWCYCLTAANVCEIFSTVLAAAPAAPAADAGIVDMYRHLQKVTPYRFKKIQDAAVTDGGDVLYFHKDRFDAALLDDMAAPSPAGVDGMGNTAKLLLPALRQYMHNDGSGLLAGYDLETTQAIIDGLRGEVARYKTMSDNYCAIGMDANQRIGELEGLLLRVQVSLSLDDTEWGYSGAEKYKLLADIRAALSAGKEGE